jgi:hypothetical protein
MDLVERLLEVVIVAAVVSYAASTYILRDYWSALHSAVCALAAAITLLKVKMLKCRRHIVKQCTQGDYE